MAYAGLADHSSLVYKKIVENHYVKSQFAHANGDNAFGLCEQLLYLIDMLQEDIKAVQRYKIQFRSILIHVINSRNLITIVQDYLAAGMDNASRKNINQALLEYFEVLTNLKKEIVSRCSKKNILQKSGKSALKSFNTTMTKLCQSLQQPCDSLHNTMRSARLDPNNKVSQELSWVSVPKPQPYNASSYNIKFTSINFQELGEQSSKDKDNNHVSKVLEIAEMMIEDGKNEAALQVLNNLASGNTVGSLSDDEAGYAAFLTAKVHAKLHNHAEALKALQSVSNAGVMNKSIMQDAAFNSIRNMGEFGALQKKFDQNSAPGMFLFIIFFSERFFIINPTFFYIVFTMQLLLLLS